MEAVKNNDNINLFFMNHPRLKQEKKTVNAMIFIYCYDNHSKTKMLCNNCLKLSLYAEKRLFNCPYGENKPTCENCDIHCYKPNVREKIKKVMKYSGPHMAYKHPILSIIHLLRKMNIKSKSKKNKRTK